MEITNMNMAPKTKSSRVHTEGTITSEQWVRSRNQPRNPVFRSSTLLRRDAVQSAEPVSRELEISISRVYTWPGRYRKPALHGISDLPRPDRQGTLSSKKIKKIPAYSNAPSEARCLGIRSMAGQSGVAPIIVGVSCGCPVTDIRRCIEHMNETSPRPHSHGKKKHRQCAEDHLFDVTD